MSMLSLILSTPLNQSFIDTHMVNPMKFSLLFVLHQTSFSHCIFFFLLFLSFDFRLPLSVLVHSLSHVRLFATPRTVAHMASLSITNSWRSPKLMSIEPVMPSNHLILCHPLILLPPFPPSIRVFPMSQLSTWGGQSIGVSASASVLPMNTQDWSTLGWTGWMSLQSKGHSRVFSNTTVQKHQFSGAQLSL